MELCFNLAFVNQATPSHLLLPLSYQHSPFRAGAAHESGADRSGRRGHLGGGATHGVLATILWRKPESVDQDTDQTSGQLVLVFAMRKTPRALLRDGRLSTACDLLGLHLFMLRMDFVAAQAYSLQQMSHLHATLHVF
eukprot:6186724-Pleurochrysis_carterae.AAC.2